MIDIRKFNETGLKKVNDILVDHISKTNELKSLKKLAKLARDPSLTEPLHLSKKIDENKKFKERYEFAKYIHKILKDDIRNNVKLKKDIFLWTWLNIIYIEQFALVQGNIKISSIIATYILDFKKQPADLSYRNISYSCFNAYEAFGNKMKFICGPNPKIGGATGGEFWEQCLNGPLLFSNKKLFNLCCKLYTDPITGYAKASTASKYKESNGVWVINKTGPLKGLYSGTASIRRFIEVIKRIQKKYRFTKMGVRELESLLPNEFSKI